MLPLRGERLRKEDWKDWASDRSTISNLLNKPATLPSAIGGTREGVAIFLVSDTRLSRDALAQLLAKSERLRVAGSDMCRVEALDDVLLRSADLLLVDMTSSRSLSFMQAVVTRAIRAKVLAYGVRDVQDDILACAEAGATGYLLCDASVEELQRIVVGVLDDHFAYPPEIVARLVRRLAILSRRSLPEGPPLSPRENQIVGYICEGLTNKEIAHRLSVEVHTVKNHVHNILTKLQLHSRAEATRLLNRAREAR